MSEILYKYVKGKGWVPESAAMALTSREKYLLRQKQLIDAVRSYRARNDCSLRVALDACNAYRWDE